jgi:hypothetical protein
MQRAAQAPTVLMVDLRDTERLAGGSSQMAMAERTPKPIDQGGRIRLRFVADQRCAEHRLGG